MLKFVLKSALVKSAITVATVTAAISLVACSEGKKAAGGVSEETNTLAGVLINASGDPVSGVAVCARHYTVDTIVFNDTTDSEGRFGMPLERSGQYGISARTDSLAVYESVEYSGTEMEVRVKLSEVGNVSGKLNLRPGVAAKNVYVSIPGSDWGAYSDSLGRFKLEGVPVGVLPLYAKSPDQQRFNNAVFVMKVYSDASVLTGPVPAEFFEKYSFQAVNVNADAEQGDKVSGEPAVDTITEPTTLPSVGSTVKDSVVVDTVKENISGASYMVVEPNTVQFPLASDYGLRSWWNMDYVSGGNKPYVADMRGWTEDMLLYGGASQADGVEGKALELNGASQYGVIESDRGLLDSATTLVLEAWVNVVSVEAGSYPYRRNIVGKLGFGSESDQSVFSLAVVDGDCNAGGPSLAFFIASGDGEPFSCENAAVSALNLKFGKWVYVTAVWDSGYINLYQDGERVAREAVDVKRLASSPEPVFFGKEAMDVKLDNVRIGVQAITDSDVLYRYYWWGGAI